MSINKLNENLAQQKWPKEHLEILQHCPICGGLERNLLYQALPDQAFFCAPGTWTLYSCQQCHSAYVDPRPDEQSIGMAYRNYFTHQVELHRGRPTSRLGKLRLALTNGYLNQRWGYNFQPTYRYLGFLSAYLFPFRRSKQDRLVRNLKLKKPGKDRILDVGSGNGAFLSFMRSNGWQVEGLEVDQQAIDTAVKEGLPVQAGQLVEGLFEANSFDAITLSHVIEHLHHPAEVIANCYRILRPGGYLWIATPNINSLGHAEFGQNWFHLDPPRHLLLFNFNSLCDLLKKSGFEVPNYNQFTAAANIALPGSLAIEQGRDPINDVPAMTWQTSLRIRWMDFKEILQPNRAEELTILVRKPYKS